MRKALATLALAAVPAIAMTACNGPSNGANGVSALPNAARMNVVRPHDFSSNDLHAGGATFPAYAYNLGSQPTGLATQPQAPPGTGSLFGSIKLPGNGSIYYCLTGSGTGRGIFETGSKGQTGGTTATTTGACAPLGATPSGFGARVDPPDFAASDVAMSSLEYTSYKTTREPATGTNWGEPVEVPVIGGPIVYGYRTQDFKGIPKTAKLQISSWTLCAIANGIVSDWNDPAITADNGGVSITKGVSQPITFYFRSDGSGTSYNFTYHLAATCGTTWRRPYNKAPYEGSGHSALWSYGANQSWPGPGSSHVPNAHFIGESGNPGVLAAVQSTPFAVGYLEGAWAKSANPAIGQALMQSGIKNHKPVWSDPTNTTQTAAALAYLSSASITFGGGSDSLPLATTRPECVLYIDPAKFTNPIANHAPVGTYPINAVSYLLFYGNNNGVKTASKQHLLYYMTTQKARTIESNFEYTPLPLSVAQAVRAAVKGSGGKAPCVQ